MAINLLGFTIGRTTGNSEGVATEPASVSTSAISPDEYDGSYSFETGGIMGRMSISLELFEMKTHSFKDTVD